MLHAKPIMFFTRYFESKVGFRKIISFNFMCFGLWKMGPNVSEFNFIVCPSCISGAKLVQYLLQFKYRCLSEWTKGRQIKFKLSNTVSPADVLSELEDIVVRVSNYDFDETDISSLCSLLKKNGEDLDSTNKGKF